MKETINWTLWGYEQTFAKIKLDEMQGNFKKLLAAMFVFPFMFTSIILALFVEEPIKILMFLMFFQTTPKKAWEYYKKLWKSLVFGMRK